MSVTHRIKTAFSISVILFLMGCASLPQNKSEFKKQYFSHKINENVYLIYWNGESREHKVQVETNLLKRASLAAIEDNFESFVVLKEIYKTKDDYLEASGSFGVASGYADSDKIDIELVKKKIGIDPVFLMVIKCFGRERPWGAIDARNFLRDANKKFKAKKRN